MKSILLSLFLFTCVTAFAADEKSSITITVQNQSENPGRVLKTPLAQLAGSSAENINAISAAFSEAAKIKPAERIHLSGANSTYVQIDIGYQGQVITLCSVHPIYESGGQLVATQRLLQPLGENKLEDVLKKQPQSYQDFRKVFDGIYEKVVGDQFCMNQLFE